MTTLIHGHRTSGHGGGATSLRAELVSAGADVVGQARASGGALRRRSPWVLVLVALLQPLALVLVPAALAGWAYTYRQFRADGDDDWFTRTASRVRRWAAARRTAGSPALAGGRA